MTLNPLEFLKRRRIAGAEAALEHYRACFQTVKRQGKKIRTTEKELDKAARLAEVVGERMKKGRWWHLKRATKRLNYHSEYILGQRKSMLRETVELVVLSFLLALFIRAHFIQAFKIPSGSMEDTLLVGDFLLVDKITYGIKTPDRIPLIDVDIPSYRFPAIREPHPGDVVVFKYPRDPKTDFIKRCIATGGQTVEIINKKVYVDSELIPLPAHGKFTRPWVHPREYTGSHVFEEDVGSLDNMGPFKVPEGMIFAMGDNRDNSSDSRTWGFVPRDNLKGKALFIYWSWNKSRWLPRLSRIGDIIR